MDLFAVVNLENPRAVAVGVRPLGDGEQTILEATAGRVVDLVIPESEGSPIVVAAEPLQEVAPPVQQGPDTAQSPPSRTLIHLEETDSEMEEGPRLTRKRALSSGGESSSKRPRTEVEESPSFTEVQME
jgi:hypothetical protein